MKNTKIEDAIAEVLPYGPSMMNLPVADHNFFFCKVMDRNKHKVTEHALINRAYYEDYFDAFGNILENAKGTPIYKYAEALVESSFDNSNHPHVPEHISKTPELVDGLATLLTKCGLSQAGFYRHTCAEIYTMSKKKLTDQTVQIIKEGEISDSFNAGNNEKKHTNIFENEFMHIARKYWDHDLMGGNPYGLGLVAYHLTMTILDPNHEASTFTKRAFSTILSEAPADPSGATSTPSRPDRALSNVALLLG